MTKRLQELQAICKGSNISTLYAFGSRASELLRLLEDDSVSLQPSASDLDIAIFPIFPLSIENKVSLTLQLETLFNVPRVDLVILQEADAFLTANIIRGERLYAADTYTADEYELYVLRRAGDLADFERERMAMILQMD